LIAKQKEEKLSQLYSSYKKLQMLYVSKDLHLEEKKQIGMAIKSIRKAILSINKSDR